MFSQKIFRFHPKKMQLKTKLLYINIECNNHNYIQTIIFQNNTSHIVKILQNKRYEIIKCFQENIKISLSNAQ